MTINLIARADEEGTPLNHSWNEVAGAGRAAEGLRADWQAHLHTAIDEIEFRYIRFHGLFHDDMFVYRENADGEVEPYFQYVDSLFDRLVNMGIRPFVELGFAPSALARETNTVFWWRANGSPPTDLAKWSALVTATVEHWIARYGFDEVAQWYFEVWNEPNLHPFFRGSRSEYFELYRASVLAVKGVDSRLRVGGPATSNFVPDARFAGEVEDTAEHATVLHTEDLDSLEWRPVWLEEFFDFCKREGLPVDFVSCHPYPTDWALDEHGKGEKLTRGSSATPTDLAMVRALVDSSPFSDAEIHLTEWSSSSSSRDYTHDYPQAATFVVKSNLESIGLVDSLSYWTFTDIFEEEGAGQEPFHGGFGMISQHGVKKPTFHAYRMMASLGDTLIAQVDGGVLTREQSTGRISGLFYHYPPEETQSVPASFDSRDVADATLAKGTPRTLAVTIDEVATGATFELEVIGRTHGNVVAAWRELGSPLNLSVEEQRALILAGETTHSWSVTAESTTLTFEVELDPWTVLLLTQRD